MAADAYIGRDIANQFRILEKIGSGGMGAVYKAEQPEMRRYVAIKILHPRYLSRPDLVSRFRREARAMSHLQHPNTAKVYLYGQLDDAGSDRDPLPANLRGACYFVMEYLEGRNLAQTVRAEGPMDPARAINIMIPVCAALEEAHSKGIVHRDLKPENIFLTNLGGMTDFPKVLDFGLAKVTEREMRPGSLILTQEGMVFGTPEFMSPEQARGEKLDGRSDIYSLGVILYELLTGKLPYDAAQPMEFIQKHIKDPPIPLEKRAPHREFPPGLWDVIAKALAKDPAQRFQTANELAAGLRDVLMRPRAAYPAQYTPQQYPGQQLAPQQAQQPYPQQYAPTPYGAPVQYAQTGTANPGQPVGAPPVVQPSPHAPVAANTGSGLVESARPMGRKDDEPVRLPTSNTPWLILGVSIVLAVVGIGALVVAIVVAS